MSTKAYKVVKGTSKSWTDKLRTVMQTTDIPVAKDSKLSWRDMWEIEVVSIMKEDFMEKDVRSLKDRSKYRWLPNMATCSKRCIGSLFASSDCECINSCANQILTLLGDGEMEKFDMCRMKQDFIVLMRKHYPQDADE